MPPMSHGFFSLLSTILIRDATSAAKDASSVGAAGEEASDGECDSDTATGAAG